jgi:Transposase DDE domain
MRCCLPLERLDLRLCGDNYFCPSARVVDAAQRRWKVERLFAWLQNYRRVVVRYERHAENFLGMLHLACCLILLRCL